MYIVTGIDVIERRFLSAINIGQNPNLNDIVISLERSFTILWFITINVKKKAYGSLNVKYNIYDYIRVGDPFIIEQYPMLVIK